MGCQKWDISGGEPMLRTDFAEIFDYITRKSVSYSINTNGTLISPKVAQLMKRKGVKMVALYGATAPVHDHITRNPGSFEAAIRGISYLKEAGAGLTIQLIPMRDNFHQFNEMMSLAKSLSPQFRVGAAWLHLSACGDPGKNREISAQRLRPWEVIQIDQPDLSYEEAVGETGNAHCGRGEGDLLFSSCISSKLDFHVDPYGQMTFCNFVKDPSLRYDLRKGSFRECWDEFIPSLSRRVRGGNEYVENCGTCDLRRNCRWCAVYGYLEHRRLSAPVKYLCEVAQENRKFKEEWEKTHRRYYGIGGITIQVESDLPIADSTFHSKFRPFQVDGPGKDMITIRHHFQLPNLDRKDLGKEVYRKPPWAIYKNGSSWIYLGISPREEDKSIHRVVVFNHDHTRARIYNDGEENFLKGNLHSLTLFPTDQILIARVLADREGCYLHASGVIFERQGLLFVGHSEAGKSTTTMMFQDRAEILCDDRIIVRRDSDGFRIFGTWSHGDVPLVSPSSAPLRAVLFLRKSSENRIVPIQDKRAIMENLLSCLIRPFVTEDWWNKTLNLIEGIVGKVPSYDMEFDRSGKVIDLLTNLR